jgi:tetratricopeptide (TPR) repeat protein
MRINLVPIVIAGMFFGIATWAQRELVLPRTGSADATTAPKIDSLANYTDRREAALAAFQAGFQAATVERKRDRATRLMLLALRRDPTLDEALYNLGVLCAQYGRWSDAISFHREAQQRSSDPELAKLIAAELKRLEAVASLEATSEGSKRRQYGIRFLAVSRIQEAVKALPEVEAMTKRDPEYWEAFALAGILHADDGAFAESLTSLEAAAAKAPDARRSQIQAAAEIARREVNYTAKIKQADQLWEQKQVEAASKTYREAWEIAPANLAPAVKAVTGYLLLDKVPPAVEILARMRGVQPSMDVRWTGMLRELSAISEEAKIAAARPAAPSPPALPPSAQRIRGLVGALVTPEMELLAQPDPPLRNPTKKVVSVPDAEITSGQSELGILSTTSIFALYQRDLAAATPVPEPGADAGVVTQPGAAPTPVGGADAPPPAPAPARFPHPVTPAAADPSAAAPTKPAPDVEPAKSHPAVTPAPAPPGAEIPKGGQRVDIISEPAGAMIMFDQDGTIGRITCLTPCQLTLPPGRHTFQASLKGYRDAPKIVPVGNKPEMVHVALEQKVGVLQVSSDPPGRFVFVNGSATGKVTPTSLRLPEGTHEIRVDIDGSPILKKIEIRDGDIQQLELKK